jgi:hypothetical protein
MRIEGEENDERQATIKDIQKYQDVQAELDRVEVEKRAREAVGKATETQRAGDPKPAESGADKLDATVNQAHAQNDRGESWQAYQDQDRGTLPQSVEEQAKAQAQREQDQKDAERRVTAAELQFQIAQQGRGLRG